GPGEQHRAEQLARLDEVVQIRAGILACRGARASLVERPRILGMTRVAQIDPAGPCERLPMPAGACRHHAIEHVDAAPYGLDEVCGGANTHEVAGLFSGEIPHRML